MGIWDVEQSDDCLANRISLEQLKRWYAFYRVEPFGQDWRRTARLAVAVSAAVGGRPRSEAEDMFLPGFDPNSSRQSVEEMAAELAKLKGLTDGVHRKG